MPKRNIYYCALDTTKTLLELGWCYTTDNTIVEYTEDFVYDNEPEHPESHKAGEIRTYAFSWIFDEKKEATINNQYPLISIEDAKWFLWHKYNVFIKESFNIGKDKQIYYKYELQYILNESIHTVENDNIYNISEDCIFVAINDACKLIKREQLKMKN